MSKGSQKLKGNIFDLLQACIQQCQDDRWKPTGCDPIVQHKLSRLRGEVNQALGVLDEIAEKAQSGAHVAALADIRTLLKQELTYGAYLCGTDHLGRDINSMEWHEGLVLTKNDATNYSENTHLYFRNLTTAEALALLTDDEIWLEAVLDHDVKGFVRQIVTKVERSQDGLSIHVEEDRFGLGKTIKYIPQALNVSVLSEPKKLEQFLEENPLAQVLDPTKMLQTA